MKIRSIASIKKKYQSNSPNISTPQAPIISQIKEYKTPKSIDRTIFLSFGTANKYHQNIK
ncbi:hypothetical protein D3C87_1729590 [compost metagenome]